MVGIIKVHMRQVLHVSKVNEQCWPYAVMYVPDVMRHRANHCLWARPASVEVVAVTHPRPKEGSNGQ
eukprot:5156379-Prorocentrum_lima.AAC.1